MKAKLFAAVFVLCWLPVVSLLADTIRLKSGKILRGTILSETDTEVSIDVALSGGTILKTESVKRADIAELTYATPEEKAQEAMEQAYRETQKYALDPSRSFALEYYDRVIKNVLRSYLEAYSNSVHIVEIQEKAAQWQSERDTVATGKAKFHGHWLPAAEAAELMRQEAAREQLARARALADRGKFDEALTLAGRADSEDARRLQTEIYERWLKFLEDQIQSSDREVQIAEQRLVRAQQSRDAAQRNLESYLHTHHPGELGYSGLRAQYEGVVQRAEEELKKSEGQLGSIRDGMAGITKRITDVRTRLASIAPYSGPPPPSTSVVERVQAPPPSSSESPELLGSIGGWLSQYWYYLAGAALLGLWLLSRTFR